MSQIFYLGPSFYFMKCGHSVCKNGIKLLSFCHKIEI